MNLKIVKFVLIFSLFLVFSPNSLAAENEYGSVYAWFNDESATVEGYKLKVNEPFEVIIDIESKIDGNVYVQLYEPGVTTAYEVIDGPSKIEEWIDNPKIQSGWKKTYRWTLKPDGGWTGGNAPINIMVSFSKEGTQQPIEFTIANPYILDEQYSGPAPTHTPTDPSSTDQPPGSNGLPGFEVVGALLGISLVLLS
ncbi:MAG: sarcinarray family MAST domain-containing protein, partial [Methanosarcinales archaeon]|nr:sarcinarray family MAST domain-containing protein [Methanosarcinales archaeon]